MKFSCHKECQNMLNTKKDLEKSGYKVTLVFHRRDLYLLIKVDGIHYDMI